MLGVDFPWVSVITLGGWFPLHLWERWAMCFIAFSSSSFFLFLLLKREGETYLEVLSTLPNTLEDLKCLLSVGFPMGRFFERVLGIHRDRHRRGTGSTVLRLGCYQPQGPAGLATTCSPVNETVTSWHGDSFFFPSSYLETNDGSWVLMTPPGGLKARRHIFPSQSRK